MGASIRTGSGRTFYYDNPEEFEYSLNDIGNALGNLCRYAGQGSWWSVAQHSILVRELVEPRDALRALLHDASEAFVVDVPGPLKHEPFMAGYVALEDRIMRAIHRQFGVPEDTEAEERVKVVDRLVRHLEQHLIGLGPYPEEWETNPIPDWIIRLADMHTDGREWEKLVIQYMREQ